MDDRARRAAARASWPVHLGVGEDASPKVPDLAAAAERVRQVGEITRDVWALTGRPWPTYDRASMPVRVVRRGEDA